VPRVELIDPETAPPETQEAYDEIRSDWGGKIELEPAEERQLTACLARTTPIQPATR